MISEAMKAAALVMIVIVVGRILAVPADAISIATRISDQSTDVSGGDRLYFEVEIKYPENDQRKDLRIEYQVLENGKTIASEKVLRAVETQASFLEYIVIPKNASGGIHELKAEISDYADMREEVSATFNVLSGMDRITIYFFILLGAVCFVGCLVIVQVRSILKRKTAL
jgi:hypothetical protein